MAAGVGGSSVTGVREGTAGVGRVPCQGRGEPSTPLHAAPLPWISPEASGSRSGSTDLAGVGKRAAGSTGVESSWWGDQGCRLGERCAGVVEEAAAAGRGRG